MSSKKLVFTVPDDCDGMTARVFLRKRADVSARIITLLKREKDGILRDKKILRTVDVLRAGDVITLNLPEDKSEIIPVEGGLDIIFEDDYLIALDKPASMPVHPTKKHQLDTLANRLAYLQRKRGESYVFRALNRLDKDTSGLVLVAKDKYTATALKNRAFKKYYAVCEGVVTGDGVISSPIRLSDGSKIKRVCAPDGQPAVTHYEALRTDGSHTLLRLWLETGRTHQIRCHMADIGHPLAGDDMYGGSLGIIARQALHCCECGFTHPISGEKVTLGSPLPEDIRAAFPYLCEGID